MTSRGEEAKIQDATPVAMEKPSTRPGCAYTQASRTGESCYAVLGFSPVDLQEATSKPGIRVAECCPVVNPWHLLSWPQEDSLLSEAMLWVT